MDDEWEVVGKKQHREHKEVVGKKQYREHNSSTRSNGAIVSSKSSHVNAKAKTEISREQNAKTRSNSTTKSNEDRARHNSSKSVAASHQPRQAPGILSIKAAGIQIPRLAPTESKKTSVENTKQVEPKQGNKKTTSLALFDLLFAPKKAAPVKPREVSVSAVASKEEEFKPKPFVLREKKKKKKLSKIKKKILMERLQQHLKSQTTVTTDSEAPDNTTVGANQSLPPGPSASISLIDFVSPDEILDDDEREEILNNAKELLEQFGRVIHAEYVLTTSADKCSIVATFQSKEEAASAVSSMDGVVFGGQAIRVEYSSKCSAPSVYQDSSDSGSGWAAATTSSSLHAVVTTTSPPCTAVLYLENMIGAEDVEDPEETMEVLRDVRVLCSSRQGHGASGGGEEGEEGGEVVALWVERRDVIDPSHGDERLGDHAMHTYRQHSDRKAQAPGPTPAHEQRDQSPSPSPSPLQCCAVVEFPRMGDALVAAARLNGATLGGERLSAHLYDTRAYLQGVWQAQFVFRDILGTSRDPSAPSEGPEPCCTITEGVDGAEGVEGEMARCALRLRAFVDAEQLEDEDERADVVSDILTILNDPPTGDASSDPDLHVRDSDIFLFPTQSRSGEETKTSESLLDVVITLQSFERCWRCMKRVLGKVVAGCAISADIVHISNFHPLMGPPRVVGDDCGGDGGLQRSWEALDCAPIYDISLPSSVLVVEGFVSAEDFEGALDSSADGNMSDELIAMKRDLLALIKGPPPSPPPSLPPAVAVLVDGSFDRGERSSATQVADCDPSPHVIRLLLHQGNNSSTSSACVGKAGLGGAGATREMVHVAPVNNKQDNENGEVEEGGAKGEEGEGPRGTAGSGSGGAFVVCVAFSTRAAAEHSMIRLDGSLVGGQCLRAYVGDYARSIMQSLGEGHDSGPDPSPVIHEPHEEHELHDTSAREGDLKVNAMVEAPHPTASTTEVKAEVGVEVGAEVKTEATPSKGDNLSVDKPAAPRVDVLAKLQVQAQVETPLLLSPTRGSDVTPDGDPLSCTPARETEQPSVAVGVSLGEAPPGVGVGAGGNQGNQGDQGDGDQGGVGDDAVAKGADVVSKYTLAKGAPKQGKHDAASRPIAVADDEINTATFSLLSAIATFQARLKERDPIKAKQKMRFVVGLKQVLNAVKGGRAVLVVLSPDTECSDALDAKVDTVISEAQQREIPVVYALTRRRIAKALQMSMRQSAVAVYDADGAYEYFKAIVGYVVKYEPPDVRATATALDPTKESSATAR